MRTAVLIPVYNNASGLNETLRSLTDEALPLDIIVVDDGSSPPVRMPTTAGEHAIFLLRRENNGGIANALNTGVDYCISQAYPFVARLDASDVILPGRLAMQLAFLRSHPNCGVVSSFVDFFDNHGQYAFTYRVPTTHRAIRRRLFLNNCLVHSSAMFRTEVFTNVGGYNTALKATEDYELFLRIAERYDLAVIPEVLTKCKYDTRGISVSLRHRQQRERLRVQMKYFNGVCPASYLGLLRTLLAMITPHAVVRWYKQRYLR